MTTIRVLALALAFSSLALTESQLEITGVVADPSGAAIVGAEVVLTPPAGAEPRRATTGDTGRFRFPDLAPGRYELRMEVAGFKPVTLPVKVGTRSPASLRVTLALADLREKVAVEGGATQVSAEAGDNLDSVRLDRQAIKGLPILGNDVIGAAAELLNSSALGTGGASIVVDGMETSEKGVTASAIQEVRINQDPYSAEFSRPGRGRIEVITKPGTKEFHGEFNFLFRDSFFEARNAFSAARPNEQRRIFEGNLTGPIGKSGRTSFVISANHEAEDLESVVYAITPAGEVRTNFPQPQGQDEWNARITRQIGKAHTLAFRYEFENESARGRGVGGFTLPEAASDFKNRTHHLYFNYRGILTHNLVNEFSLRGGRHNELTTSRLRGVPAIVVLDAFTGGGAQADRRSTENHVQFTDTLLWTHGKHLLKFGLNVPDWSRRGSNDHSQTDGVFTFSSLEDYARGTPFSYVVQRGDGYLALWQKEVSLFVQDNFKLRPNLSLSFGLRYDWQNHLADHNNFAPRFSVAWSPLRSRKTVLRGGAGFFYDRTGERAIGDTLRFDGHHLQRILIENPGYPNPLAPGQTLSTEPATVVRFAPGLRSPYLFQYSFGAERQLAKKLVATANYTRVRGVKSFRSRDVNAPPPPLYAARPDPAVGTLRQIESAGRLASQSFEAALRGTMGRYFQGFVQYTTGSAWNNTGGINALPANSYDLRGEWSHAPFDMRHRFTVLGSLRPEKLFNLGVRVDVSSGAPYTLTTGRDDNHDGLAYDRPPGVPRNSLRRPPTAVLDLRWSREFPLQGGKKKDDAPSLEVTLDAFNALNHVNVSSVVGNMSSPLFGQPVAARPPRRAQLSLAVKF